MKFNSPPKKVARKPETSPIKKFESPAKLVEYKRKVILKALCDFNDIDEPREIAQKKLNEYLECDIKNEHLKVNDKKINQIFTKTYIDEIDNKKPLSNFENKVSYEDHGFNPKWEHYDIMKSRWKSIKPQTMKLIDFQSQIIPSNNDKILNSDSHSVSIKGDYMDLINFENTISTSEIRANNIMLKTRDNKITPKSNYKL